MDALSGFFLGKLINFCGTNNYEPRRDAPVRRHLSGGGQKSQTLGPGVKRPELGYLLG